MLRLNKELPSKETFLSLMGDRIYQLRIANGLSLRQLAATSSIDNSKLAKIEKGQINITALTFYQICIGLGITPYDFWR